MSQNAAALPILYTFRRCPYAIRARLAIVVSGVQLEQREVVLRDKPAEMLAASPKGTVPVLLLPVGEVIEQSLDIMLWALRLNDPQQWLTPTGAALEDMLALVAGNDGAFKRSLNRYKYPNRYADESAEESAEESASAAKAFAVAHRSQCATWLEGLEARLAGGWLFGHQASLADMGLLPFVRQFAHTDASWFASQPWPRLQAWLAAFETSAIYLAVMEKRPPWQAAGS